MAEEILINSTSREVRVALLENGALQEVHIERKLHRGLLGNIYKGKISRLLVGLQAAFVDIGLERGAFLHLRDVRTDKKTDDIRDILHVGQELLVQVYKNPLGSKGARLTTNFTIPSRYLVFTPFAPQLSVSQKITDEKERERLLEMVVMGNQGGYIFRTASFGAEKSDIDLDIQFLDSLWQDVLAKSKNVKVGALVYEEIPINLRVLRDLVGYEVEKIRVDDARVAKEMQDFATLYLPKLLDRIEYYAGDRPIFDIYSVEDEIQKALQRKVHLKSGGYLIFDQTEAMTTIDVNTGSYLGHGIIEETIFKTNLEALEVIARQVRLRNLGGIIIIDFIDMTDVVHKTHLLQLFMKALAKDNARIEISEISSLGLVQMTRKRTRESLEHVLCVTCPLCQKRGSIKSIETICYEIFREIQRIAENYAWTGFLVLAAELVIEALLEDEALMLAQLETTLGRPIKLQIENSYMQEQYDILPMSEKV
jgi:ribonuclease G